MFSFRKLITLALVLVATLTAISGAAQPAMAALENPGYCSDSVAKIDQSFGAKTPVILVHGMEGNPSQWRKSGGSSIYRSVNNLPGARVALSFQYTNALRYVGHGKRLAASIDCVSRISKAQGGSGKVILVGYSLGAVISQVALNEHDANGKLIAKRVGQFITIANANESFPVVAPPGGVRIHAIAASIRNVHVKNGVVKRSVNTKSDDDVTVRGATSQVSGKLANGGGKTVLFCDRKFSDKWFTKMTQDAPCRHGELLKYKPVNSDIITSITRYLNFVSPPTPPTVRTWTVGQSLTVRLDERWGEIVSATGETAEGYVEGYVGELGTNRKSLQIDSTSQYNSTDFDEQIFGSSSFMKTGAGPSVTIGGRTPDYSASFTENTIPVRYSNVWCFTDEAICVFYRGAYSLADAQPSAALKAVFSTATWSR